MKTGCISLVLALAAGMAHGQTGPDCPMHAEHPKEGPSPTAAAPAHVHDHSAMSPYAGGEGSEVKSLTDDEIRAYRDGTGMGLAKPAELNHYPGPRHVLDLAGELGLSEDQTERLKKVFQRMHERAVEVGGRILEKEKALDRAFASGKIDDSALRNLTAQIASLQADLRAAHLAAHLETKRILTPRQVGRYDEIRGYGKPEGS
jgi:Spy/CpxP family protein refolding chaperone